MTWLPIDCHAHTTMSDGTLDVDELIDQVRSRGVRPSVADHISRDVSTTLDSAEAVEEYLGLLERHDVARGGEFCWHDSLWRELPPAITQRFTHLIGSLHAIVLENGSTIHAFRAYPADLSPDAYMDAHLANLERFAREMPVDILGHPTLLPLPLRRLPIEELWTEEREERAVRALGRAGIAFEVSNRYRAHERFVRRAVEHGVRLSLGSDGHGVEQVGDVEFPLALARAAGARDADLYDPFEHGSLLGATPRISPAPMTR